MIFFCKVLCVFLSFKQTIDGRSISDKIFFPNENLPSYLNLNGENEILPFNEKEPASVLSQRFLIDKNLENGKHFQGDILMKNNHNDHIIKIGDSKIFRTGILHEYYRWPKTQNFVIVPFFIDSYYSN